MARFVSFSGDAGGKAGVRQSGDRLQVVRAMCDVAGEAMASDVRTTDKTIRLGTIKT
jgi:hypothetical protein